MATNEGAGWKFDFHTQKWIPAINDKVSPVLISHPVRLATLNVLHDKDQPDVLFHDIRYEHICAELRSLNADIIGLNEVTPRFLNWILSEEWVQNAYTVSVIIDDPNCEDLAAVRRFGNLLLSRIPFISLEYFPCSSKREFHVAGFNLLEDNKVFTLAVAAVHLSAFPFFNEHRRMTEIHSLSEELTTRRFDGCIVMGDFNFHREDENRSIPHGWSEIPSVVNLGTTWEFNGNAMISRYLPSINIYNGFGCGWGCWTSRLRLDRVLINFNNGEETRASLFANQPIYETYSSLIGKEVDESTASSWKNYLYPSDHYGITFDILLTPPASPCKSTNSN